MEEGNATICSEFFLNFRIYDIYIVVSNLAIGAKFNTKVGALAQEIFAGSKLDPFNFYCEPL